jgi:hypothetical protein
MFSTESEIANIAASFLAYGLRRGQHCWYVRTAVQDDTMTTALEQRGVEVAEEIARGALRFVDSTDAYVVAGEFSPEHTAAMFSSAIERALADGFTGLRIVSNMSWLLDLDDGMQQSVACETLLRTVFASSRIAGLCLYDRARIPLSIVNGALITHRLAIRGHKLEENPFYDPTGDAFAPSDDGAITARLQTLESD